MHKKNAKHGHLAATVPATSQTLLILHRHHRQDLSPTLAEESQAQITDPAIEHANTRTKKRSQKKSRKRTPTACGDPSVDPQASDMDKQCDQRV